MKFRALLLLTLTTLLFGCSDENKEVRGEFLAGCVQGGAPKCICSCTFEKLQEKYTPEELKLLSRSMSAPPERFIKDVIGSAMACRSE